MKPPKPEAARPGAGDGATDGGSQDPRTAWPGTSPTGASDAAGDEAPEEGAAFQALTGAGTGPGTAEAPGLGDTDDTDADAVASGVLGRSAPRTMSVSVHDRYPTLR
ncbi:hypothetical protein ACNFR6_30895, partial [Streptomyces sp. ECR3]